MHLSSNTQWYIIVIHRICLVAKFDQCWRNFDILSGTGNFLFRMVTFSWLSRTLAKHILFVFLIVLFYKIVSVFALQNFNQNFWNIKILRQTSQIKFDSIWHPLRVWIMATLTCLADFLSMCSMSYIPDTFNSACKKARLHQTWLEVYNYRISKQPLSAKLSSKVAKIEL